MVATVAAVARRGAGAHDRVLARLLPQAVLPGDADQLTIKYGASLTGGPCWRCPCTPGAHDKAGTVARYREADTLIQNACGAIGDLMLVYKKVQRLAGLTTRVSELLEALQAMEHSEAKAAEEAVEAAPAASAAADDDDSSPFTSVDHDEGGGDEGGEGSEGGARIGFDRVSLKTPDGRLLVKDLSLSLPQRRNLLVTGPNGAGKSSLMRALRLVAAASGQREAAAQRPLCAAECLPDERHAARPSHLSGGGGRDDDGGDGSGGDGSGGDGGGGGGARRARRGLRAPRRSWRVAYLARPRRVAARLARRAEWRREAAPRPARVLYHRPTFAVLDEATSAVNSDEQGRLHECLAEAGITLLSIAHRPEVKRYHHLELQLAGDGSGTWSLVSLRHE